MRSAVLLLLLAFAPACSSSSDGGEGGSGGQGGGDAGGEGGGGEDAPVVDPDPCDRAPPDMSCIDGHGKPMDPVCDSNGSWSCSMTPLVLSFDGAPITYATSDLVAFDLTGDGLSIATDWPTSTTPWLALDRDGDGVIDDGSELFGSGVRLATGGQATNGFAALAELDDNGDGRIDARDARFGELLVWADANADRATTSTELTSAAAGDRRVVSIDLDYHVRRACNERGNCGVERSAFVWADASGRQHLGEVIDVHLPMQSR
jgi:hypothetical protein